MTAPELPPIWGPPRFSTTSSGPLSSQGQQAPGTLPPTTSEPPIHLPGLRTTPRHPSYPGLSLSWGICIDRDTASASPTSPG